MQDQPPDLESLDRLTAWLRSQPDIEGLHENCQPRNLPEALVIYEASQDMLAAYLAGAEDQRKESARLRKELATVTAERDRAQMSASQIAARLVSLSSACRVLKADMLERALHKVDRIHGEQHRVVNAGNGAWMGFCEALLLNDSLNEPKQGEPR